MLPGHCFDASLADFKRLISNEFIQYGVIWLNFNTNFNRESKEFEIIFPIYT